jgi:hypothetical protein
MSLGGPLANWGLVVVVLVTLPVINLATIMLLAATIGVAINVCIFELPVIQRVFHGAAPGQALPQRVAEQGRSGWLSKSAGLLVGAGVFLGLGVL